MSPRIVTLEAMLSANAWEFDGKKNFFFFPSCSLMFHRASQAKLKTLECSDFLGDCSNVACNSVVHDELVPHSSSNKALIACDQFMAWYLASREIEEINHITKVSRDLQGNVTLKQQVGMIFTSCFWNYLYNKSSQYPNLHVHIHSLNRKISFSRKVSCFYSSLLDSLWFSLIWCLWSIEMDQHIFLCNPFTSFSLDVFFFLFFLQKQQATWKCFGLQAMLPFSSVQGLRKSSKKFKN